MEASIRQRSRIDFYTTQLLHVYLPCRTLCGRLQLIFAQFDTPIYEHSVITPYDVMQNLTINYQYNGVMTIKVLFSL